jgi:hypothetical protein
MRGGQMTPEQRKLTLALLESPNLNPEEKAEVEKLQSADSAGRFEQESLLKPTLKHWPYYPLDL